LPISHEIVLAEIACLPESSKCDL